jgi:glycosyltransferase involved in cell wall biosynthesis
MAQYVGLIDAPAVLHEHNIESEVLRRYAEAAARPTGLPAARRGWPVVSPEFRNAAAQAGKLAAYELEQWPRFPARVTVSERDRQEMLRRCSEGRVVTVPNGVNTRALRPVADLGAPGILYSGSLDYQPNLDAVAELCAEIWPRVRRRVPDARLYIVGRSPPPHVLLERWASGATVVANAPDLAPYAARCCVSAVPLRVGGGSRLKILAAMALGLPVVSTTLGREGLELRDGEELLVADDPEAFAEALVRVLRDRPLRSSLARAGRAAVEARHDWQHLLPGFEQLLEDIAADPCIGVPSWLAPHPT